jgi:hypothetical protein
VRAAAEEPPEVDEIVAPGDCLYVPRGWLHSATALGGTSIHLTIGVHVWTQRHLAEDLLTAAGHRLDDDVALRESLPVGVDPLDPSTTTALRARVRAAVDTALDAVPDEQLAGMLAARARAAQRAEPLATLRQHVAAEDPHTTWRARRHLAPSWVPGPEDSQCTLVTRVGRVPVPAGDQASVDAVLRGERTAGILDADLRRTLCRAGVLVPVDPEA